MLLRAAATDKPTHPSEFIVKKQERAKPACPPSWWPTTITFTCLASSSRTAMSSSASCSTLTSRIHRSSFSTIIRWPMSKSSRTIWSKRSTTRRRLMKAILSARSSTTIKRRRWCSWRKSQPILAVDRHRPSFTSLRRWKSSSLRHRIWAHARYHLPPFEHRNHSIIQLTKAVQIININRSSDGSCRKTTSCWLVKMLLKLAATHPNLPLTFTSARIALCRESISYCITMAATSIWCARARMASSSTINSSENRPNRRNCLPREYCQRVFLFIVI